MRKLGGEGLMKFLLKVEKFFDLLMSFASLVGFASTAYLVWIFIHAPPSVQVGTENVGVQGLSLAQQSTVVIQGVPFFWVFTSLLSLSAGHTYRAAKHLVLTLAGKNYFPHAPHLMHTQPTPTPTAPRLRQTESSE
jgi:hypothetical protein